MEKKISLIIGTIILVAAGIFFHQYLTGTDTVSKEKAVIGYFPAAFSNILLFNAIEKGYLKGENVEIELVKMNNFKVLTDSLVAGRIDAIAPYGTAGIITLESASPNSFKGFIVGSETEEKPYVSILVAKNSTARNLSDLRSKKIATAGSTNIAFLKVIFSKQFEENEIQFVNLEPTLHLEALSRGSVDALYTDEPLFTIAITKGIAKELDESIGMRPRLISNPFPIGVAIVFSKKFLDGKPRAASVIKKALKKSINDYYVNETDVRRIAARYSNTDEKLAAEIRVLPIINVQRDERINAALRKSADVLYEGGIIKKKINAPSTIIES